MSWNHWKSTLYLNGLQCAPKMVMPELQPPLNMFICIWLMHQRHWLDKSKPTWPSPEVVTNLEWRDELKSLKINLVLERSTVCTKDGHARVATTSQYVHMHLIDASETLIRQEQADMTISGGGYKFRVARWAEIIENQPCTWTVYSVHQRWSCQSCNHLSICSYASDWCIRDID